MKTLSLHLQEYLALRRKLGFKLCRPGSLLRQFVRFAKAHRASFVTTPLAVQWATQSTQCQPAFWTDRLGMVRCFARYLSAVDPRTEIPPQRLLPHRRHRKSPYLYDDQEVVNLVRQAKKLRSPKGLRGATLSTLLGLLAATGLRVGEAVGLDHDSVDLEHALLTVRHAKGDRTRLVPLHPSTCLALERYERLRNRVCPKSSTPSFFLSEEGNRLTAERARFWFIRISRKIGLREPKDRRGPRLHDLRHRFAIQALLRWYRTNKDIEQHLPELSTYLGHARVTGTYWYLSAAPELLQQATRRWTRKGGTPLS